ncbi:DNA helicase rad5 [Pseudogymnoascus australis]
MDSFDLDGRPAKKRRFFTDKPEELEVDASSPITQGPTEVDTTASEAEYGSPREAILDDRDAQIDLQPHTSPENALVSDQETFELVIGDKIDSNTWRLLQQASGDNMERAINMYFDGSWRRPTAAAASPPSAAAPQPLTINPVKPEVPNSGRSSKQAPRSIANLQRIPESRYIGAFGVEGWATRSGTALIKHGERVRIERQKIQPPKLPPVKVGRNKIAPLQVTPKPRGAAARRIDVIVRFTNARGEEVGRLSRETANWVSTLIDQQVCTFEGVCVYAPDRVRTNDTIFLQLRCMLLKSAFDNRGFKPPDNRTTGLFEEKETSEEKDLRLRQVALVKLLVEVNLLPSRTSETTTKHKRQGLLQAAEVAEQYEKEAAKKEKPAAEPGSSPSSDSEEGKELEQDQLDTLYRKAQSFDFAAPEAEPAETFAMDLRPYQKQALHWMMAKEKDEQEEKKEASMHPLWEEYVWPVKDMDDQELPPVEGVDNFYLNPYSGELLQTFSSVERAPCTTLVVAPMSLLAQWQSEAENASKEGTLKSVVYYGNEKAVNLQSLCCAANAASAPNVIITSYGVVLSEFNQVAARNGDRGTHGGLFSLNFFRVILDEAHHIKNRQSKTARACYEIEAEHRWVLTGTPIVNRLEDLFSLVRFLRVEPWSNFSFWKTFITVPFESKDFMRALDVVQTVLEPLVLRRTKDMKTPSGEALVPLPPKTIEIVNVELSESEREVYEHIFFRAKRTFAANVEAGTVMKAYTSIFAQILRLRQTCCHPILVRKQSIVADELEADEAADAASGLGDDMDLQSLIERFTAETDDSADANVFGAHVLEQIRDEADNECPICSEEPMIEQTVTGCWHSACKKCLLDYISHQVDKGDSPRCFNCRELLNTRDIFEVVKHDADPDAPDAKPRIALQRLGSNSSAKITALITQLKALRREHPGTKSVIFSQFTSFLSLIEPALTRAGVAFLRLDGTMAMKARAVVLKSFRDAKGFTVILLSLRAAGVGLNLTMARRVYMMDPWWSYAVEAQAIDRVHRMGQTGAVEVKRFIVRESVEERMLRIQERKKFM